SSICTGVLNVSGAGWIAQLVKYLLSVAEDPSLSLRIHIKAIMMVSVMNAQHSTQGPLKLPSGSSKDQTDWFGHRVQDQQDGPGDKASATKSEDLSLIPVVEGESRLPKFIVYGAHAHEIKYKSRSAFHFPREAW
ncbi:hypothetical protein STEG23_031512, partial [Scotinomys teguina]